MLTKGAREGGSVWGCRMKCEVLAINGSLPEQCSYTAPSLHLATLSELDWIHWFPIIVLRK